MINATFPAVGYPPAKGQEFLAALASAPEYVALAFILARTDARSQWENLQKGIRSFAEGFHVLTLDLSSSSLQ